MDLAIGPVSAGETDTVARRTSLISTFTRSPSTSNHQSSANSRRPSSSSNASASSNSDASPRRRCSRSNGTNPPSSVMMDVANMFAVQGADVVEGVLGGKLSDHVDHPKYATAMAIIYDAVLNPSKQDLLAAWLPNQPWFRELGADAADLEHLGAFRFDDPAGEVGMETHLLSADGGRCTSR